MSMTLHMVAEFPPCPGSAGAVMQRRRDGGGAEKDAEQRHGGGACVAWHGDSARLAVKDLDDTVSIYSLEGDGTGTVNAPGGGALAVLEDVDQRGIRSLAWRPHGGNHLAVGCNHATVILWTTKTAKAPRSEEEALSGQRWRQCTKLNLLRGIGSVLFTGTHAFTTGLVVKTLAWSPCGTFLAAALSLDDYAGAEAPLASSSGASAPSLIKRVRDAVILCRGFVLFSGSALCASSTPNVSGGRKIQMRGSMEVVESLAWSRDGGHLCAMAGGSGDIWIWETISWTCVKWASPTRAERPLCLWGASAPAAGLGGAAGVAGPECASNCGASILLTVSHVRSAKRDRSVSAARSIHPVASLLYMAGETPGLAAHVMPVDLPDISDDEGDARSSTLVSSMALDTRASILAVAFVRSRGADAVEATDARMAAASHVAVYAIKTDPVFHTRMLDVVDAPASAASSPHRTPWAPSIALLPRLGGGAGARVLLAVQWGDGLTQVHQVRL